MCDSSPGPGIASKTVHLKIGEQLVKFEVGLDVFDAVVLRKDENVIRQLVINYNQFAKTNGGTNNAEALLGTSACSSETVACNSKTPVLDANTPVLSKTSCASTASETIPSSRSAVVGSGNSDDEGLAAHWTKANTLHLIDLYNKYIDKVNSGKMRKVILWKKIATDIGNFTGEQVRGRWKTITNGYKRVKDQKNKSGNGRVTDYEYEKELDETFGESAANINPITLSTMDEETSAIMEESDTEDSFISIPEAPNKRPAEKNNSDTAPKKRNSTSAAAEVISYLQTMDEKDEERQERELQATQKMHTEKMDLLKSIVGILAKK
ncbi:hypothetical protein SNE40_019899 [Patella caerulea]